MERIFIGLAIWNTLILIVASASGLTGGAFGEQHVLIGLFAAIFSCLLHSIVIGHLIGAGRAIKDGAADLDDPGRFLVPNRKLKAKVFPLATFAPLATVIAAVLGGGVHADSLPSWVHLGAAIVAVGLNLAAYPAEHHGIRRTSDLIGQLHVLLEEEEEVRAALTAPVPDTGPDDPVGDMR